MVRTSSDGALESLLIYMFVQYAGQCTDQVAGRHTVLPRRFRAAVSRGAVEPHRHGHRLPGAQALAQKSENHPAQHVSASTFCHTGISGGIEEGAPVGEGGDGTVPLQHQTAAVPAGEVQGRSQPVAAAQISAQPGELPVVGGQDGKQPLPCLLYTSPPLQRVYAVGVQYDGQTGFPQQLAHHGIRTVSPPKPRPDEAYACLLYTSPSPRD